MFSSFILASALLAQQDLNQSSSPASKKTPPDWFWIDVEALYMHATEDGLNVTFENRTEGETDPVGEPLIQGPILSLSYDWDFGCRLSAGSPLPLHGWDLSANWTWVQAHGTKSGSEGTFYPIMLDGGGPPGSSFNSRAHLVINLANLELGRTFKGYSWGYVRPHFGPTAAWVHRTYSTKYTGIDNPDHPDIHIDQATYKCQYEGGGLRGAGDIGVYLAREWSLISQLALSGLYVNQQTSQTDQPTLTSGLQYTGGHVTSSWNTWRAIAEFSLGLQWAHLFHHEHYRLRFQLAWDTLLFFNFNQNHVSILSSDDFSSSAGTLGLTGVSGQLGFDF